MSAPEFSLKQNVTVHKAHNHIPAGETVYQIGSLDRISGDYSAVLLKDGRCVGSVKTSCLAASK